MVLDDTFFVDTLLPAALPADVACLVTEGLDALAASRIPTLLVRGGDGVAFGPAEAAYYARRLPGLEVVDAGPAGHFLPEDRPTEVHEALRDWLTTLADA